MEPRPTGLSNRSNPWVRVRPGPAAVPALPLGSVASWSWRPSHSQAPSHAHAGRRTAHFCGKRLCGVLYRLLLHSRDPPLGGLNVPQERNRSRSGANAETQDQSSVARVGECKRGRVRGCHGWSSRASSRMPRLEFSAGIAGRRAATPRRHGRERWQARHISRISRKEMQ